MRIIIALILVVSSIIVSAQIETFEQFSDFEEQYLQPNNSDTTYIINFWATWCVPCVKELPYFEELNAKYTKHPIKVILVSLDFTEEAVTKFIAKKGIKSKVVLLTDSKTNNWIDKVDPNWSGAIPITLFLKGNLKEFYEKDYHNLKELETDLLKIKNNKP